MKKQGSMLLPQADLRSSLRNRRVGVLNAGMQQARLPFNTLQQPIPGMKLPHLASIFYSSCFALVLGHRIQLARYVGHFVKEVDFCLQIGHQLRRQLPPHLAIPTGLIPQRGRLDAAMTFAVYCYRGWSQPMPQQATALLA